MRLATLFALVLGCAPLPNPPLTFVPRLPAPVAEPVPPPVPLPPPGPRFVELVATPFVDRDLVSSDRPQLATGTVRTLRTLREGPGVGVRASFDSPRRVVIETVATGAKRYGLVDPTDGRTIADVAEPAYFYRLSPTEMVVRHGTLATTREAVVDTRTGTELALAPIVPIAAPIENVYILHDEHEDSEAFVL